nr:reverse transcriptase domain-containing protein [Tanacetum cinerariifolium]
MADNRTMEELLQTPTEGYGEAIVIPEINADHFEIKTNLLQLVQANTYHGFERENPHTHINNFKRITLTLKFRDVPNDVIKLTMFPYLLEGAARVWYDKESPNSILTWKDLETFGEACDRFKEMLRAYPHHGFTELTQIDTLYNGLNENDQDSLNATADGNLLSKTTREALHIIKNKSKVRYSRNKPNVSRMNTTSKENASETDDRIDKLADQILTLVEIVSEKVVTPATVKAVEEFCITCGGNHAYYNCDATNSNQSSICATTGTYNQVVERETKETMDKEQTNFQGSIAHIQPPVVPIPEPDFADALLLMPKLASTIKSLLANKGKLFELAKIPLNENYSTMLLKKLPEKLGDPGKFLIPCDFPGMDRIDPLIAKDVFVKVEKFYFPTDFVVVVFEADPRTTRYSSTFDDMSVNRIDVIDVVREEYAQEILGFSNNFSGGNPTLTSKPIISNSSPSLTSFEGSDFILEEIDAYLKDESISPEIDHADCDPEGDICLIKKLLNDDPFQLPPMDLKQAEVIKAKSLIEEPLELELKDLPSHLEYAYLEGADKLPVIIAKDLKVDEKESLLKVLKSHKRAIAWKITDIKSIDPRFCTHKILMEEYYKPAVQSQRQVNPKLHEVIKKEVIKLLDAEIIYPISDSPWVSLIHCVPKKEGITVVENETMSLFLHDWSQMLERLVGNEFYCFLDRFFGYFQILISPPDQEKTTFTCPYGSFAYRRMPFGLCNAPRTFQRCMMEIFHDMIEKTMEVFMNDFLVFRDSFSSCLSHLDTMLQWEKCHFMVKEGIILGHKISKNRLEVDRAKVDVITKLPHPTIVKGVRSFLDCIDAFETLKKKLTEAPILVVPNWNLPFERMCDASDFAIGAVLGQ